MARSDDEGSAMVEFLGVSLLLLVPIVYLVVAIAQVQAGTFAADIAAREAARSAVVAGVAELENGATREQAMQAASDRANAVVALTAADFGIDEHGVEVSLACVPAPCFAPGSDITARVSIDVALPGTPTAVAGWSPAAVHVSATSGSPVDGFASGA